MHVHMVAAAPLWPAQLLILGTATQRSDAEPGGAPAGLLKGQGRSSSSSSSSSSGRPKRARPGSHAPFGPLLLALPVLLLLLTALPLPVVGRRLAVPRRHLAADRASDYNAAAQQPCMPCASCITPGCRNICSNSCARSYGGGGFPSNGGGFPSAYGFAGAASGFPDPGQCKQDGLDIADDVAQQACRGVQSMCQAGMTRQALQDARGVPSSQCAAQANAACQKAALASSQTPCGANLYFGFRSCSGRQFNDMYRSYVSDGCQAATSRY